MSKGWGGGGGENVMVSPLVSNSILVTAARPGKPCQLVC